jgi:Carboxypeptidase regulatory-like domain
MAGPVAKNPLRWTPAIGLVAAALCLSLPAHAASPIRFSGELGGIVTDVAGKPQPGAIVLLFNKQDRLLLKVATDDIGAFAFAELMPDLYSVQVSLASFVPAMKERVQIRAGMRSLLSINLSKVFSSVQLVSTTPLAGGLMSDSWKWTLRSDDSLRPVLRILPVDQSPTASDPRPPLFSDSRGLIRLSAGDSTPQSSAGEADLGTQFAFATSIYGGNHFAVAGDVGYAPSSGSSQSAAFRTTYSRDFAGAKPAVSLTMRQFYMPLHFGQAMAGSPGDNSLPALRTLGVSFDDQTKIGDDLSLEYGFELDSVSFLNHLSYFSPYAKLSREIGGGHIDFTWTSGNARPELGLSGADANSDLQRDLTSLATLPGVTLRDGSAKVQRGEDYEAGASKRLGSREYRLSAYYNDVANTTLMIANPQGNLFPGDLLPDLFSNSALFNAGSFQTFGYNASVTQDLGHSYKIMLIVGEPGVLAVRSTTIDGTSADDLRKLMQTTQRPAATLRASGTIRGTGTRFSASYEWTNYRSAVPGPVFTTQSGRQEPGLNIMLRQPIPSIPGMHGRVEAYTELRNLLAQGYLPLNMPGGQQVLLVNTPRSLRGGLAFIF